MLYFYGDIAKYVNFGYIFLAPTPTDAEARRLWSTWKTFFIRELSQFIWDVYQMKNMVNYDDRLIGKVHENINEVYRRQLKTLAHQKKPGGGSLNELPIFRIKNNTLKFPRVQTAVFDAAVADAAARATDALDDEETAEDDTTEDNTTEA